MSDFEVPKTQPVPREGSAEYNRRSAFAARFLAFSLLGGAATGFMVGNTLAQDDEHRNNREDLRTAAGYEHCADFVQQKLRPGDKTVTMRARTIGKKMQKDCGFVYLESNLNNDRNNGRKGHAGGKITQVDALVKLPTDAELSEAIAAKHDDASYDHAPVIADTALGVAGGVIGGTALFALAIAGNMRLTGKDFEY